MDKGRNELYRPLQKVGVGYRGQGGPHGEVVGRGAGKCGVWM